MSSTVNFKKILPEKDTENFKIPLVVTTTNLYDEKIQYFKQGFATPAIVVSASILIVLLSVTIIRSTICKWGVLNNFPIRHIHKDGEKKL
jgi:predicted acylesterase/phospholipase RssA